MSQSTKPGQLTSCDQPLSVFQGCNGPVKNNGLLFSPPYNLVAATKVRSEYFKDGRNQMPGPSNKYFHVFHENPFTFPFEYV